MLLRRILPVVAVLLAGGSTMPLSASLIYSNDLSFPNLSGTDFLSTTYAPVTSETSAFGDDQVFVTDEG